MARQIFTSTDYKKFKLLPFNRDVEKTKDLEATMQKYGSLAEFPIVVKRAKKKNEFIILFGHRRFEMCRKYGLPVHFVITSEPDLNIHELEKATKTWSLGDYLVSYVRKGHPAYVIAKRYHDETGISLGLVISMLMGQTAGTANGRERFKEGKFAVRDTEHLDIVVDVVQRLRISGIDWANRSPMVCALSRIVQVPEFKIKQFCEQIEKHSEIVQKQPNLESYLKMLEDFYNYHRGSRIPLAFLAAESARKRSIANQ